MVIGEIAAAVNAHWHVTWRARTPTVKSLNVLVVMMSVSVPLIEKSHDQIPSVGRACWNVALNRATTTSVTAYGVTVM